MKVGEIMATASTRSYPDYTSIAGVKAYWIETIAPNYFDFTNVNNYNVGLFGYVNEVMGNTAEDSFNAVAIARREFYPVTAQFTSSLYAMATLQSIDIPLTTPATCRCILFIPQNEIIDNSVYDSTTGLYNCTIDNCLKIFAGDLQFMLDYPIQIISNYTDRWTHTVHYDVSVKNSLNTSTSARYISNRVLSENGQNFVALFVDCIRQLEMQEITKTVVKDTILDTVTMDIDFDGNLANFEVFYKENSNTEERQLTKVLINAKTPATPYVQYQLVNQNKIRLTFAYNTIFTPKFNSEIIVRVYTSEGKDGNFNQFKEDLVCSSNSEKYPYNSNFTILGRVSGSATGGKDQMISEQFRNKVLQAYATNMTITTDNDLQFYFDDLSDDIDGVKILFKKKRDDAFIRLFGAYSVYKDAGKNVIPTNTLEVELYKHDIVEDVTQSINRMVIPAGTVFKYKASDSYIAVPAYNTDGTLMTLMDVARSGDETTMYFATPFLIGINLYPNNCGYYMNSVNQTIAIEYTYINDNSAMQFIGSTFSTFRNALDGSNYYKFRIMVSPASDMDINRVAIANDPEESDNQIRAEHNGIVLKEEYFFDETIDQGYVRYVIEYTLDDDTTELAYIQASNTLPINHTSITGYKMKLDVGDTFTAGDILAVKRCDDQGTLVMVTDLSNQLYNNNYYIPLSVQDIDESTQAFILEGYLATDDAIDISEKMTFTHGIFHSNGQEATYLALNIRKQIMQMHVLYRNEDNNVGHQYDQFTGLGQYTLTNSYVTNENEPFDLVTVLSYIRSNLDFYPIDPYNPHDNQDFQIVVDEVPLLGAAWASDPDHFNYFVTQFALVNDVLNHADLSLNNTFSIDTKFYNTYGKARFFTVGNNQDSMNALDSVRCKFHFGVSLNLVSNTDTFLTKFRKFIQEYIEDDDRITTLGQDLYILNMISAIQENFSEILFIEYYGFNSYGHNAQKIIGPDLTVYYDEFIPEFLNLNVVKDDNGNDYPEIIVDILT